MGGIYVDTSDFINTHGKQPRGYGAWAFNIDGTVYTTFGKYSEAKADAVTMAVSVGTSVVFVLG